MSKPKYEQKEFLDLREFLTEGWSAYIAANVAVSITECDGEKAYYYNGLDLKIHDGIQTVELCLPLGGENEKLTHETIVTLGKIIRVCEAAHDAIEQAAFFKQAGEAGKYD